MWRLQYRNFGSHESMVINHTVDANGRDVAGVRWYELRRGDGGNWSIFQQGTHASDDLHRWMASAAMDHCGNIAVGYSVSSKTESPGIRLATRSPNDTPGELAGGEVTLVTGSGSQTHPSGRWGNYSSMNVDPKDPSTFWYTSLYYSQTSAAGWRTRVSSVKLPPCEAEAFEYAAKFICGVQKDPKDVRLSRGSYATVVNVHNPNPARVTFRKKLALTFPPGRQHPGKIIPLGEDRLDDDEALAVTCAEIDAALKKHDISTPYAKGFVVIQSPMSLDVTAVYTVTGLDARGNPTDHTDIDVEQIKERRAETPSRPPDLVPVPDEHGSFCKLRGRQLVVTVRNQGAGGAGPSTTVVDFGRFGTVSKPTPALDPGEQTDLLFDVPPNAFDPDLDFQIRVDSNGEVPESNEGNNNASGVCIG